MKFNFTRLFKGGGNVVLSALFLMIGVACNDNDEGTEPAAPQLGVSATVATASFDGITLAVTAGADAATIEYAVGGISGRQSDLAAFDAGTMEVTSVTASDTIFVEEDSTAPVVIYLRGVSAEGEVGETCTVEAMAAPVALRITDSNTCFFTASTECYDPAYSNRIGLLTMSKEVIEMMDMTAEEILEIYAMYDMLDPVDEEGGIVLLNGEPDYEFIIGMQFYDAEGNMAESTSFAYTSNSIDPDAALPDALGIEVEEITETAAAITFTAGANTAGYYYAVYTQADYDSLIEDAKGFDDYEDPEAYIVDYTAYFGYLDCRQQIQETWSELSSGTDYVVVGVPFNVNGAQGYGELTKVGFSTPGTPAEPDESYAPRPASTGIPAQFGSLRRPSAPKALVMPCGTRSDATR